MTLNNRPQLIVGTSTTHILNYVIAFSGSNKLKEKIESMTSEENRLVLPNFSKGKTRKFLYHLKVNDDTSLFVCPFLGGQSGIKSDDDCKYLGGVIGNYLNTKKIELV